MTAPIPAALTPAEWATGIVGRPDLHVRATASILVASTPGDRSTLASDEDRHALAALALHNQPFGFTADELDALDVAIDAAALRPRYMDALRSLAAKLSALLPPEGT